MAILVESFFLKMAIFDPENKNVQLIKCKMYCYMHTTEFLRQNLACLSKLTVRIWQLM